MGDNHMNFENRINVIHPATSIEQIAEAFFNRNWPGHGYQLGNIIFVDDQSPHGTGILEVAVVDQERGKLESITVGWCRSVGEVLRYFRECLLPDAPVVNKNCRVPLSGTEIKIVHLECGCCGQSFSDDYHAQKRFDQDTGFGICKDCQKYY